MESLGTTTLHELLTRYRAGDNAALDTLLLRCRHRLEQLASRMLARFPSVKDREQTDDVLQNALLKLSKALDDVDPSSTRDFYALAATQMRRTLLDLARYHRRRPPTDQLGDASHLADAQPEPVSQLEDLGKWEAFHDAVEGLPERDRETFHLQFYHGWSTKQIAELLEVSDRQVRRWWTSACLLLNDALHGQLPEV